jgi:putative ABC transport system permease protein
MMMRPPLLFRALLRLYPAAFRTDYADEMWRVFSQRRRDAGGARAALALWLATIADTLVTAAQTHWDILRQDLAYALRTFRRAPGFTATVLVVTALGIGANTAAFSLTNHVLLRPLPFADASRLVAVWQNQIARGYSRMETSPANYRDWKAASTSFEGMAAYNPFISANLVGEGQPERLEGTVVTADLLPLVGAEPVLGRLFSADDDREGAPGTVLLSWSLWQGAFGGDRSVVGSKVTLDGEPYVVIGVMPRSFAFPSRDTQFWQPIRFDAQSFVDRTDVHLRVVAKLRPGVSLAQARAEMNVITEQLERAYPKENASTRATVNALADEVVSDQSRALVLALSGAAAAVLLIACLNLANLLLARALARRKELALRAALGAGRERLVRQLVTESLLLAVGGGVLGVLLALVSLPALTHLTPSTIPIAAMPVVDLRVLGVAAAVTLVAALAFGVLPALRACGNVDPESLREGSRAGVGRRRARLRKALVIAEVSASLVLLVCSGLLLRALWRLQDRDPGFRSDGVMTLRTWLPVPKYERTSDRAQFYDRVLARTRALPGVSGAAYISFLPMTMGGGIWPVSIVGRPQQERDLRTASLRFTTPGFFGVLDIPLRSGRDVGAADTAEAPYVAVVSQSFASRYWPDEEPIGKRFEMAFAERTVVGVAGDIRVRGLERDSEPQVYLPYRQVPDGALIFYAPKELVVGSSGDSGALVPALRAIIAGADAEQPVSNVRTLGEIVDAQTASRRVQLDVIGVFAGLAFLLAAIGIYGLLSFGVSTRSQEIGVRMALGATPRSILVMVLGEGFMLAAVGAAVGLAMAYVAGRSLEALLAGVTPTDGPTLAAALAIAVVMTLAGSVVPAWRAARVDPATVMRAD